MERLCPRGAAASVAGAKSKNFCCYCAEAKGWDVGTGYGIGNPYLDESPTILVFFFARTFAPQCQSNPLALSRRHSQGYVLCVLCYNWFYSDGVNPLRHTSSFFLSGAAIEVF